MTRNEQIQKLIDEEMGVDNYGSLDYQVGVCDGVRFADKTMLEKACKWLTKHLYDYDRIEGYEVFRDVKSFVNDFCKAMKE